MRLRWYSNIDCVSEAHGFLHYIQAHFITCSGSFYPLLYYGFHCHPTLQGMIRTFAWITCITDWGYVNSDLSDHYYHPWCHDDCSCLT